MGVDLVAIEFALCLIAYVSVKSTFSGIWHVQVYWP